MDELKQKLAALGLSGEQADQAIATVADFVKARIPESFHSMIDDVLAGRKPDAGGFLGGLFGGK